MLLYILEFRPFANRKTFRRPFADFATAAKTHIYVCKCHLDTKSLAWVLERLPYIDWIILAGRDFSTPVDFIGALVLIILRNWSPAIVKCSTNPSATQVELTHPGAPACHGPSSWLPWNEHPRNPVAASFSKSPKYQSHPRGLELAWVNEFNALLLEPLAVRNRKSTPSKPNKWNQVCMLSWLASPIIVQRMAPQQDVGTARCSLPM